MYIILIEPTTLELIEALNNGVRPEIEEEATVFIYKGKDEVPEIISAHKFLNDASYDKGLTTTTDILYKP